MSFIVTYSQQLDELTRFGVSDFMFVLFSLTIERRRLLICSLIFLGLLIDVMCSTILSLLQMFILAILVSVGVVDKGIAKSSLKFNSLEGVDCAFLWFTSTFFGLEANLSMFGSSLDSRTHHLSSDPSESRSSLRSQSSK